MNELIQKFIWKNKGTRKAKTIFKNNQVAGFRLLESYSNQEYDEMKEQADRPDGIEQRVQK